MKRTLLSATDSQRGFQSFDTGNVGAISCAIVHRIILAAGACGNAAVWRIKVAILVAVRRRSFFGFSAGAPRASRLAGLLSPHAFYRRVAPAHGARHTVISRSAAVTAAASRFSRTLGIDAVCRLAAISRTAIVRTALDIFTRRCATDSVSTHTVAKLAVATAFNAILAITI